MSKKFRIVVIISFLLISLSGLYFHNNFFKFQSIFFEKKWKYTQEKILLKNEKFLKSKIMEKFF